MNEEIDIPVYYSPGRGVSLPPPIVQSRDIVEIQDQVC